MTQPKDRINLQDVQEILLDQPDFMKDLMSSMLQKILNAQFEEHIGVSKYERNEERRGYRNGAYERQLKTPVGQITLSVCRDREGTFQPHLFARYQRSEKALVLAIIEMYFKGVATRKIDAVIEELCGTAISKSQVSELTKTVEGEMQAWRSRPLTSKYDYLFEDAIMCKVREGGSVVSRAVLVGIGVTEEGYREVIATENADSESEHSWGEFFKGLKERGLSGVQLVISDQHAGLKKAIAQHFQGILWQRCQVHFMRNFMSSFSRSEQGAWMKQLKDVFNAPEAEQAKGRARELADKLRSQRKIKQAEWIEENIEDCLTVYVFPEEHRKKLRTTNVAERLNGEIRRRINIIRVFPDSGSLMRVVTAECTNATEKWMEKRYMEIRHTGEIKQAI
jgi:transposase-like protein